eukprot:TRINITY_DN17322_c0_g1_i1.p1 TRINITY_DN17322_c0_g1~~TRINITY_DN17322_c0_g1_i1.p1  ORF type:complete len:1010 (-),score=296.65 TRINITY_DN17322_c0_g1_i1:345-3374(-)
MAPPAAEDTASTTAPVDKENAGDNTATTAGDSASAATADVDVSKDNAVASASATDATTAGDTDASATATASASEPTAPGTPAPTIGIIPDTSATPKQQAADSSDSAAVTPQPGTGLGGEDASPLPANVPHLTAKDLDAQSAVSGVSGISATSTTPKGSTRKHNTRKGNRLNPAHLTNKSTGKSGSRRRRRGQTLADDKSMVSDATDVANENPAAECPDGVVPVFLKRATQTIFHAVPDTDVSRDQPFRLIGKNDLQEDLQNRSAVSDFFPLAEKIEAATEEDILLVYDADHIYGENFFLCLTAEARKLETDRLSGLADGGADIDWENLRVYEVTPSAVPWESKGSEAEVDEAIVTSSRGPLALTLSRRRAEFGAPVKFSDRDAHDGFLELRQYKDPNFELRVLELDVAIQAVPPRVDMSAQTNWYRPVNGSTQYDAIEMTEELKTELMEQEDMTQFLKSVAPTFEYALEQNETVNVFRDDFIELGDEESAIGSKAANVMKEYSSFADLVYCKDKYIACIDWQPQHRGILAVAVCDNLTFDQRVEISGKVRTSVLLVWNFVDPIQPQFVLEAPYDVYCFRFHPERPHIIVGGLINGQVLMWDIASAQDALRKRNKSADEESASSKHIPIIKYVYLSSIEGSHKQPVSDITWLSGHRQIGSKGKTTINADKQTYQFVTTAGDGQVLVWDIRVKKDPRKPEAVWNPSYRIPLIKVDGSSSEISGSRLSIGPPDAGSNFYVATEEGELVHADWAPAENEEKVRWIVGMTKGHHSACTALQRSPFYPDTLLTVGDWTFNIWKEGVSSPIFSSPPSSSLLRSGCWSPTRPGVLFTGKADGKVEIWDLTDRSHEPSMIQTISSASIEAMEFWTQRNQGRVNLQLIAVGDSHGTAHVLELPRNLVRPIHTEEQIMQNFFDREVERVSYMEKRNDFRRREIQEMERQQQMAEREDEEDVDEEQTQEELRNIEAARAEEAYRAMEANFKLELGIDESPEPDLTRGTGSGRGSPSSAIGH